jgi:hypothetical protein
MRSLIAALDSIGGLGGRGFGTKARTVSSEKANGIYVPCGPRFMVTWLCWGTPIASPVIGQATEVTKDSLIRHRLLKFSKGNFNKAGQTAVDADPPVQNKVVAAVVADTMPQIALN